MGSVGRINSKMAACVKSDLVDLYHLVGYGPMNNGKPRPVIVKFTLYKFRDMVFKNKKTLLGSGIVIRKYLAKSRLNLLKTGSSMRSPQSLNHGRYHSSQSQ